ncbi:MAG: AAA family ATPase, partial [Nanoarchaeota archaeon]
MPHQAGKVIMLYGHPMSGKTTAAARIQEYLRKTGIPAEIISSAKSRLKGKVHSSTTGFVDEGNARTRSIKDKAYKAVCNAAVKCLSRNVVPILDATFHKLYRREWVYALAK